MLRDFQINPNALEACQILQSHGFQSYIVGGCVRDLIMGTEPKDWDITTDATPEKVMEIFPKHYATGLQHGTVTVAVGNEHFEVTTFRVEGKYTDGRRPDEVKFVTSIEEDLGRRDLTINAIAYDPINKILKDPYDGIDAIEREIIKAVGDPNDLTSAATRFMEDGLRIMRVARFASRFQFAVDYWTMKDMWHTRRMLEKISLERVHDELVKTLATKKPSIGLELLYKTKCLEVISPVMHQRRERDHFVFTDLNDFSSDVTVETKLAFILAETNVEIEEMKRLKFSNQEIKKVSFLLDTLDRFMQCRSELQDGYVARKFLASIKNDHPWSYEESLNQFIYFAEIFCAQYKTDILNILPHQVFSMKELQINGKDVLDLGIVLAGPIVGNMLDEAYQQILINPENNNREWLKSYVKSSLNKALHRE